MLVADSLRKNFFFLRKHLLPLLFNMGRAHQTVRAFQTYSLDWNRYTALPDAETLRVEDAYPCLYDRTAAHPLDAHYFYQDVWAFKSILAAGAKGAIPNLRSRAKLTELERRSKL